MERRQADLPARIAEKEAALHALVASRADRWVACKRLAAGRVAQLSELEKLGTTGHAFVLRGWAPARDLPRIERTLSDEVGKALLVRQVPIDPEELDRVPVVLDHTGLARPFGYLLELFALRHVRTEGGDADERRDDEQQAGRRSILDQHHAGESETRRGESTDEGDA